MRSPLKIGFLISILIFVGSLCFYFFAGEEGSPFVLSTKARKTNEPPRQGRYGKGRARVRKEKRIEALKGELKDRDIISFEELETKRNEYCKEALEKFNELEDYFDSSSELFKYPDALVGKLDYILGEVFYASSQYFSYHNEVKLKEPKKKSEFLHHSQLSSGCSSSADLGVLISSTLEAMKSPRWSEGNRKKAERFFVKLAVGEVLFYSWESLFKSSGILLPILIENYPNSPDLDELKSIRSAIIQEMRAERNLIKRSLNIVDAKSILAASTEKRLFYGEQIDRLMNNFLESED